VAFLANEGTEVSSASGNGSGLSEDRVEGMNLPQPTLTDLQVMASMRAREDDNGHEMILDSLRKYCAQCLLNLENEQVIKVPTGLRKNMLKYNRYVCVYV
jgi:hypothetical protein